jgi:hypothetical protein
MPNSGLAELYFIAAMFALIFIICGVAVFFFFRTFKREKRAREEAKKQSTNQAQEPEIQS